MHSAFINPKSVAVVGASSNPSKMGFFVLNNITQGGFKGEIYPINPKTDEILGLAAYKKVSDTPTVPELVVVTTPAQTIPDIVSECANLGVPAMIIISAGFREVGEEGKRLEAEIMARKGKMRVAGPNCLGFMSPVNGLNATFANRMAKPGTVGVISQSGAILTALLDWAEANEVGFSQYISLGIMLDWDWKDALFTLGADPKTKSIIIYMESIGDDAQGFVSAAREISAIKPIIIMKPGKSKDAARAAASHTGAITGSDAVLDAVFARAGIVRVETIDELFSMAELAHLQPKGNGLTIITNAGGPGVMAVDALAETAGELTKLTEEDKETLSGILPFTWSHNNPIDIIGDATPNRYKKTIELVLKNESTNAVLVILSPQVMTDPTACARAVIEACKDAKVPVLTSWMGGATVQEARQLFRQANIPTLNSPDHAATMFGFIVERARRQRMLYETPGDGTEQFSIRPKHRLLANMLAAHQRNGDTILSERDAKAVLRAYDIPVPDTLVAETADIAMELANELGYPVVLKLHSRTITHKTDVGGVKLNLVSNDEVRNAFLSIKESAADGFEGVTVQPFYTFKGTELIIGATTDPQLGPIINFGHGGTLVEILQDVAIGLPPLNQLLAQRLMESTKIHKVLQGYRGALPVDLEMLESVLVSFARLVEEHGETIKEIEINPLLASAHGLVALDARVILYKDGETPVPQAIRPYPVDYVHQRHTKQGDMYFTIRPLRSDDEERLREFNAQLSDESVRSRYQYQKPLAERQRHDLLAPRCNIDYGRHMALVAIHDEKVLGVVRVIKVGHGETAELSLVVLDEYQNKGIGFVLMDSILGWADIEGISRIYAYTTKENSAMKNLLRNNKFRLTTDLDGSVTGIRRRW